MDEDRIVTDQDKEQAAELKVKANKAFACEWMPWGLLSAFSSEKRRWGGWREGGSYACGGAVVGKSAFGSAGIARDSSWTRGPLSRVDDRGRITDGDRETSFESETLAQEAVDRPSLLLSLGFTRPCIS